MDSQCVIYHWNTTTPTKLVNLGLPNGSSAQTIFERIDQFIGNGSQYKLIPLNTRTIDFFSSGSTNFVLEANVNISAQAGNITEVLSDGIYVPDVRDGKVRVNAADFPDYLVNKIVGNVNGPVAITAALDPSGHLVRLTPSINLTTLLGDFLETQDSTSLHLNFASGTAPFPLTGAVKISATAGNTITVNSDGIYSNGGAVSGANNGLSVSTSTIQLGGPLIKNTAISFATGAFSLSFTSRPLVYFGDNTPGTNSILQIDNTYQANGRTIGLLSTTTAHLGSAGMIGANGNIIVQSGTDTDTSVKAGLYGQIFFNDGSTPGLNAGGEVVYTGTVGLLTTYGGTTLGSASIVSNVAGIAFAADAGNVNSWASLYGKGVYQAPQGSSYSGTITNYYGLYVEDTKGSGLGARVTNAFGGYFAGTASGYKNIAETAFTTPSDSRLKENVKNLAYGLNEIEQLRPVTYNMIGNDVDTRVGFIAQEVETIIPEAVQTAPLKGFDDLRILDQNVIFTTLVNAIKELSAKVKALESR